MHAAKDARPAMHGIIYLQPQGRVNGRRTPSCGGHASMMHAAVYIAVAAVVLVTAKHEHLPNRLARAPCNERERTGVRHVNVPSAIDDGELYS